jgi:hypothetical protein
VIYEHRVYRCMPLRMPDVLRRIEQVAMPIWERHGIRQAGCWTTAVGGSNREITYMTAWESLAERDQKWSAFMADKEWIERRIASESNGPIVDNVVSSFLVPTSFSTVK